MFRKFYLAAVIWIVLFAVMIKKPGLKSELLNYPRSSTPVKDASVTGLKKTLRMNIKSDDDYNFKVRVWDSQKKAWTHPPRYHSRPTYIPRFKYVSIPDNIRLDSAGQQFDQCASPSFCE